MCLNLKIYIDESEYLSLKEHNLKNMENFM